MKDIVYIILFIFIFWPLAEAILEYWIEKGDKLIKWLLEKLK